MNHACKKTAVLALVATVALLFAALGFAPIALAESTDDDSAAQESVTLEYNSVDELRGKRLGVLNGAVFDQIILKEVDGIKQDDIMYFNSTAEIIGALKAGKIDAMITDLPVGQLAVSRNAGIGIMPEVLVEDHYGFVLEKGSPYTEQFNERLEAYREDGTLDELYEKWTGGDESAKTMPEQDWEATKGTLIIACSADSEPMSYQVGNDSYGMSVEVLYNIARDLGYGLKTRSMVAASTIVEVQSGKADVATSCFSITKERKKVVDMTEAFYDGGIVAIVRAEGGAAESDVGFFEGIAKSFERTFLIEDRWMLILSGLGVTMVISVASGLLGVLLGFALVLLRRKKEDGIAAKLIKLLENLLGGLPVVVVLMVFYYIVFGAIDIPGMIVAILAFTLIFGASSGTIMWNAIQAVDVGQTEAGRALGFGDRDTFTLVVLPQAARQFAPLLVGQFVSLVKDTSIVGYIAVQDLTRVGDLIRARTMEAFFPLISIAIIYFVLCRLMAWLLNRFVVKRLEPKEGPRTIKGVEL